MRREKIEIIYHDNDILVINKPAGFSVTKDRSGRVTVPDLLKEQLAVQLLLIHRLDKETSGVMILAKHDDAQRQYTEFFEQRTVNKTYLALVRGRSGDISGRIDAPLAQKKGTSGFFHIDKKLGKEAVTDWQVLADFGAVSLLRINPLTGRTHQIRVHLSSIGLNIIADSLYGDSGKLYLSSFKSDYRLAKFKTERPLIERMALHAYGIEFTNPPRDKPPVFIAALDKHFKAAVKMLTKYNSKGLEAFVDPDIFQKITQAENIS